MRLKVSKKVWKELNIPDKGDFKAVVRGRMFKSRYDTTAGLRLRIPSHYTYLFRENGFMENGENNGQRSLFIDLWVEDGMLCMSYKPDEEYDHYENIPIFKAPNYGKGVGFCARCQIGYIIEFSPKCPIHGITKNKTKKKKNNNITN